MAVELHGVTKRFGAVRALAGVDASFEGGRVAVVAGPNGSGKSTLLSIIGTLARPTQGTVSHGSLGPNVLDVRARLGWVGHDTLCYADLTGRENIALAARLHGLEPSAAILAASARFDLASFVDRPVRTYSRGQRQRVALARALVQAPDLLLLDEPSAGLDLASTEKLASVVTEEAERGAVVVVITHDSAFSGRVGHDHWNLARGRLQRES